MMKSPAIPVRRHVSRPQPGSSIRRPDTPGLSSSPPPPQSPLTSVHSPIRGASNGFDFNFNLGISARAWARNPNSAASHQLPFPIPERRHGLLPTTDARRRPPKRGPRSNRLYGQAYIARDRHVNYAPTERFDDWLDNVANLSLDRHGDTAPAPAPSPAVVTQAGSNEGKDGKDEAREPLAAKVLEKNGDDNMKRKCPSEDNDDDTVMDSNRPPPPKRSRISNTLRRTVHRIGSATHLSSRISSVADHDAPWSAAASSVTRRAAALAQSLRSRTGALSRTGFTGAPPGSERTVKICLVGDSGAGKTAFVNYLVNGSYTETEPSTFPNIRTVQSATDNGTVVNTEVWDLPGSIADQHSSPLVSNFFHAAIICFSVEDVANVDTIFDTWAPKLHATLNDRVVMLLALKRDLRRDFPVLDLAFLPSKESVSYSTGSQAAVTLHAGAYCECSAKEGDNVQGAWDEFINHLVASLEEHEQNRAKRSRDEKVKGAVTSTLDKVGLGRLGRRFGG